VWHGYADIFVNRSVVKIGSEDDIVYGSGEPPPKKLELGTLEMKIVYCQMIVMQRMLKLQKIHLLLKKCHSYCLKQMLMRLQK
jgi:hypothetical protein